MLTGLFGIKKKRLCSTLEAAPTEGGERVKRYKKTGVVLVAKARHVGIASRSRDQTPLLGFDKKGQFVCNACKYPQDITDCLWSKTVGVWLHLDA